MLLFSTKGKFNGVSNKFNKSFWEVPYEAILIPMTQPVRISTVGKINQMINLKNNVTLSLKATNICNQIKMSSFLAILVIRAKKVNFDCYNLI